MDGDTSDCVRRSESRRGQLRRLAGDVRCRTRHGCLARVLLWATVASAIQLSSTASAQPVHTRIEACPEVDQKELMRLLRVELGHRLEGGRDAPLQLRCHAGGGQIQLVASHDTGQLVRRLSAHATAGEVGARVLALAMIELLRELEVATAAARPPAPAPSLRAPTHRDPGPPERNLRFALSAHALWPHAQPPLLGATLSVDMAPYGDWFLLRFDAGFAIAERAVGLAAVHSRLVHVAPQGGVVHRDRRWDVWTALGYRLGHVRIAGDSGRSARPAAAHAALWGGPMLAAGGGIALVGALHVEVGAELGLVMRSVTGEVEAASDVRMDAFWFAGRLGVSYGL